MTESDEDPFSTRKTVNVILLGLVFMLLASRTPISIVKTVLYSATDSEGVGYVEGFTGDGYVANALLYSTFALANFLAPWAIGILGPKYDFSLYRDPKTNLQVLHVVRWAGVHSVLGTNALPLRWVSPAACSRNNAFSNPGHSMALLS